MGFACCRNYWKPQISGAAGLADSSMQVGVGMCRARDSAPLAAPLCALPSEGTSERDADYDCSGCRGGLTGVCSAVDLCAYLRALMVLRACTHRCAPSTTEASDRVSCSALLQRERAREREKGGGGGGGKKKGGGGGGGGLQISKMFFFCDESVTVF